MYSDSFSSVVFVNLPDDVQELCHEQELVESDIEQMESRIKGIEICIQNMRHDLHRHKQHIDQVQSDKDAILERKDMDKEDLEQYAHDLDGLMEEDFVQIKALKKEIKEELKLIQEYKADIEWKAKKLPVIHQKIDDPHYLHPIQPKDGKNTRKITEYFGVLCKKKKRRRMK
jgi:chromosome segregation ATPase